MKKSILQQKVQEVQLNILYYGTPVILLSTLNEDNSTNITPMSSSWALGDRIVLGLSVDGKAVENMKRHPECVVNVPSSSLWENVEALASYTGRNPVPDYKKEIGFQFKKDKFTTAGLTDIPSKTVQPVRINECPIQIEAKVRDIRIPDESPFFAVVEVQAIHTHAHEKILIDERHVNPAKWNPLIYNFRHYFGLGNELGKTFRAES